MEPFVDDLLRPGVELRETHISWVFLTATDVFKIKKPVDFGFLDFTTLEKRRTACEDEVRLNRRLAAGIYIGVVPLRRTASGVHHIGDPRTNGEVVDWAVHMKRLPDSDRADVRLADGRLSSEHLELTATRLARFHQASMPTAKSARYGTVETIRGNVEENFEQMRDTIDRYVTREQAAEIESWQRRFLDEHGPLFAERVERGHVRDGHGDLRLEHIYVDAEHELSIIDCIEFNERFRYADVCSDVVFLAMDLASHRRVDLAEHLLACYAEEAGDYQLYRLVDFYESYRAYVRGKIASFIVASGGIGHDTKAQATSEARRYFLLALASERRSLLSPSVIAVGGLIASGKSTVAKLAAAAMGAPVIGADRTRKNLAGVEPLSPVHDAAWRGIYSEEFTERVHQEMFRRAASVLTSGRPVVLDTSFRSKVFRRETRAFARTHDVPFTFIECRADEELCRARLQERAYQGGVSDGRLEIFDEFARRWEPVDELAPEEHLVLDTREPLETTARKIRDRLPTWPDGLTA